MNEEYKKPPVGYAERNTPIYNMIRFWGRKPWNLVRNYIEHYTAEGEIVFDPFGGCGVTTIESLSCQRRTIYNDLNAYSHFIAKTCAKPADIKDLERAFDEIINHLKNKKYPVKIKNKQKNIHFDWLYSTKCPRCNSTSEILGVTYTEIYEIKKLKDRYKLTRSPDRVPFELIKDESILGKIAVEAYKIIKKYKSISHEDLFEKLNLEDVRPEEITRSINEKLEENGFIAVAGETPISVEYHCSNKNCKEKKGQKKPDEPDLRKLNEINKMTATFDYPDFELAYSGDKKFYKRRPGTERIDKLFTKRNLIALSILKKEINELKVKREIREALLLCFAAILEHVCKMERPSKKGWGVKHIG